MPIDKKDPAHIQKRNAEIAQAYLGGMSIKEIADARNVGSTLVRGALSAAGVCRRSRAFTPTEIQLKAARAMYESGKIPAEIAAELGVTNHAAIKLGQLLGFKEAPLTENGYRKTHGETFSETAYDHLKAALFR